MKRFMFFVVFILLGVNYASSQKTSFGVDFTAQKDHNFLFPNAVDVISSSFGFNMYYHETDNTQFYSGIHLSAVNVKFPIFTRDTIPPVDIIEWTNTNKSALNYKIFQQIFITIPLSAKYLFSKKINHFYSSFGIDFQFRLYSRTHEVSKNFKTGWTKASLFGHKYLITPNVGFGYEFALFKQFKFFVEPKIALSFQKPDRSIVRNQYQQFFHYGLRMGILFGKSDN